MAKKGETQPLETRLKISASLVGNCNHTSRNRGNIHPNWKGGITELNHSIRTNKASDEWRLQIFGRDNFTCQACGVRGVYLEAHHIKRFSAIIKDNNILNINDALQCNELWDLNNGITLCKECHKQYNGRKVRK